MGRVCSPLNRDQGFDKKELSLLGSLSELGGRGVTGVTGTYI